MHHRIASNRREPTHHIQQGLNNLTLRHMSTPFYEAIMNTPKEPKVKTPTIEACDATLKGVESKSFERLLAGSIASFTELEVLFSTRFMAYKRKERQVCIYAAFRKDESVRSYVKRFNLEAGQISDLPDGVYFDNFIRGLKKGSFNFDLVKKSVRTMAEALDEDESFIHATEICSVSKDGKTREASESSGKKEKTDRNTTQASGTWEISTEQDPTSTGKKSGLPQEKEFFEYITDLLTILVDVGTRFDLERPFPMKSPAESRDPKLHCRFHEDIGHDTKDCRSLKRGIPMAQGRVIKKNNKSPVSAGKGDKTDGGFVAVISGSPSSGGPTMRGQKDYARRLGQVIFSGKSPMDPFPRIKICELDGGRIATPHDDPPVIEIKISNMRLNRILVDTGSSSDIMSMEFLNRLAHDPKAIEKNSLSHHWFWGKHHTPCGCHIIICENMRTQ
ncbi:uncharacterized protein [Spinacia oleracea]|uniref:Retrotransposon gag domain-containing protein n=1 Tax=Spinacia oleracea TaxID=3562 RepID=A0ABM3RIL7_SPIOL|nr:uncharacterized protein LOC130469941 [Spinacia oleracea]